MGKAREAIERKKIIGAKELKGRIAQDNKNARDSSLKLIEKLENDEVRMLEQLKNTQNREIATIKELKSAISE